jgi:hypothetical protein
MGRSCRRNGWKLNFCPPTDASNISPALVMVNTASPRV